MNLILNNDSTILDSGREQYDVSVCIIAYNKKDYIREAINSVLNQRTSCIYEIVVGDNASTDGTTEILREYWEKDKDKFCIIINHKNLGISLNHFNVMAKAKGNYLMILNGDDYWKNINKMQQEFDYLEENPDILGVTGPLECIYDEEKEPYGMLPSSFLWGKRMTLKDYLDGYNFPLVGAMFRNVIFSKNIDHFELMPKSSTDVDDLSFCILLLMKGDVFILPEAIGVYRSFRPNTGASNFNSVNSVRKRCIAHIRLLNHLDSYTKNTLNLERRYGLILATGFFAGLKKEIDWTGYKGIVNSMDKKYRSKNGRLLLKGILRKIELKLRK